MHGANTKIKRNSSKFTIRHHKSVTDSMAGNSKITLKKKYWTAPKSVSRHIS
jgi:hypothetical protein